MINFTAQAFIWIKSLGSPLLYLYRLAGCNTAREVTHTAVCSASQCFEQTSDQASGTIYQSDSKNICGSEVTFRLWPTTQKNSDNWWCVKSELFNTFDLEIWDNNRNALCDQPAALLAILDFSVCATVCMQTVNSTLVHPQAFAVVFL